MSLTKDDVREVFNEGIEMLVIPRFDALETRMDGLEGRMGGLETRMDNVESRMGGLDSRMAKQEQATIDLRAEIRSGFAAVNQRIDGLEERFGAQLSGLETDVRYLYKLVERLQKPSTGHKELQKLSVEQKFLTLYKQFQAAAKEAGIVLPKQ